MQGYAAARIPLDTIWSDIDHMDGFRDFTLDKQRYAAQKMQQFLRELHQAGRHWVPIIDPGILVDPGYPAFDAGMHDDIFLKGADQEPYVGQVCMSVTQSLGIHWYRTGCYALQETHW